MERSSSYHSRWGATSYVSLLSSFFALLTLWEVAHIFLSIFQPFYSPVDYVPVAYFSKLDLQTCTFVSIATAWRHARGKILQDCCMFQDLLVWALQALFKINQNGFGKKPTLNLIRSMCHAFIQMRWSIFFSFCPSWFLVDYLLVYLGRILTGCMISPELTWKTQ